jgi:hypothetical protein
MKDETGGRVQTCRAQRRRAAGDRSAQLPTGYASLGLTAPRPIGGNGKDI